MNKFFSEEFWITVTENIQKWVITELFGLVVMLVILLLTLRILSITFNRLKKTLIKTSERRSRADIDETEKRINTLVRILHGAIKIILWAIFILISLKKFGVDIRPILASAGIVGLAVGFGAQELVRDFISGFFILLENQIRVGDVAIINGTGGLVEKIELRTITLRNFSGDVHIFQNGKINSLANMTKEWSAMVFDIGVAYKEDVQNVMDIMKEVGDELYNDDEFRNLILEPIEIFGLDQFADSAVIIKARIKTKPIHQWTVGREYRKRLKNEFDNRGIEIPFPHRTVYWGENINPLKLDNDKPVEDKE